MIDYTCRICGNTGRTPTPVGYDPSVHEKWLVALCHNRCYDIREKRVKIETHIGGLCRILELSDDHEQMAQARERLSNALREWAKNEADFFGSRILYWSEEFVDLIAEKPERWPVALKMNRDYIRESVAQEHTTP